MLKFDVKVDVNSIKYMVKFEKNAITMHVKSNQERKEIKGQ